jgi:hypothetical protein
MGVVSKNDIGERMTESNIRVWRFLVDDERERYRWRWMARPGCADGSKGGQHRRKSNKNAVQNTKRSINTDVETYVQHKTDKKRRSIV